MYKIIDEKKRKRMTLEEIENEFDEMWVYTVNCNMNSNNKIIDAIPVIIGDAIFEGVQDGIYDKFDEEKYVPRCDINLTAPVKLTFIPEKD